MQMKTALVTFSLGLSMVRGLEKIPRIGIIGGGIGGTSCAFFLKSLFDEANSKIDIDIFEAEKIGGRLSVVDFSDNKYEEGGSIIHSRNKYMLGFLEKFKLEKREAPEGYFGLYDGKDFVFSESKWKVKTMWDLIFRYGSSAWKLYRSIEILLDKFDRIYDLQKNGMTFNSVESMLAAIDPEFIESLHITTKSGFENDGVADIVIDEIIMAAIRANYGQNTNIQKLVGSISIAGAIGSVWSVHGGNVKIPEHLFNASKANLIKLPVTAIKRLSSGQIKICTEPYVDVLGFEVNTDNFIYDVVILATPQTLDSKYVIDFKNFSQDIRFFGSYHKTVCTLIKGSMSEKYFFGKNSFIDDIITTKDDVPFNSIGKIYPVDYSAKINSRSRIWKVFTQEKMDEKQISKLFSEVENVYVREWLAYPHYDKLYRNDSFVLAPNLYHINAIEWAASAMEMSAIGAKNVALLVFKKIMSDKSFNEHSLNSNISFLPNKEEL